MNFCKFFLIFQLVTGMTLNRRERDLIGYNRLFNNIHLNGGMTGPARHHRRKEIRAEDIYQQIMNSQTVNADTKNLFQQFLQSVTAQQLQTFRIHDLPWILRH